MNKPEEQPPIEIPAEKLDDETLRNLVESFILREGTDYGAFETQHETKIRQVQEQLGRGDIKIVFDPNSESVTLLTRNEWNKRSKAPDAF